MDVESDPLVPVEEAGADEVVVGGEVEAEDGKEDEASEVDAVVVPEEEEEDGKVAPPTTMPSSP